MSIMLRNSLVLVALAGIMVSTPALAALDEMIVSSERRTENLQDVPIAVSALDTGELEDFQITEASDLQRLVPSLNMFTNVTQPTNLSLSLRGGLQQDASLVTAESPVGIYVDEVYVGRLNGNNVTLSDIERVEVLRGPQGTLYGRNTAYGAIRFITRTPGEDMWFNASAGYGNYDHIRVNASVGGPLGDSWAGSLSGQYNEMDGVYYNYATNEDVGQQDNTSLRGKLRYMGSDNFDAILSISYSDSSNDSNQMPKGITPNVPSSCEDFPSGMCDPANGQIAQFTTNDLVWVNGDYGVSTPTGQLQPPPLGDRSRATTEQTIGELTLTWDINERLTLKSITGYVGLEDYFQTDFSGNTGNTSANPTIMPPYQQFFAFTGSSSVDSDQFTQEFQALGSIGDRIKYIGGVYYLNEEADQNFGWNGYNLILGGNLIPGFAAVSSSALQTDVDSIAVYGQGSYNITDQLKATVGLRWTEDDKKFNGDFVSFLGLPAATIPLDGKWSEWTPSFVLDYIFETSGVIDSAMVYGSAAKGFKGGGFSAISIFSAADFGVYGPETNWTYEIGLKAQSFDNSLRTNLAFFFSDIQDIQQNATVEVAPGIFGFPVQNSGDAEIQGLEYEITYSPLDGLDLFLIGNFLDGEYKNLVPDSAAGQAEAEYGVPAVPPQVPDYTVNVGFNYTFDLPGNLFSDASFGLDYYKIDDYLTAATNDFHNSGWDIWNGFIAVTLGDSWGLRLSGKNLADDVIVTSGSRGLGGFIWLPPREYMFQVTYTMK